MNTNRHAFLVGATAVALFVLNVPSFCGSQENSASPTPETAGKPLRIIAFGAHPDDAEFQIGGTALKWATLGHKVKFVSCTNGDIGHWKMSGGELSKRRTAEVKECAKRWGIEVEVLDIHDGELEHTLENRKIIARLIRDWQADLVFGHRPYDYHPDHRNVGMLVRDAAFMVMVPNYVPDTPPIWHRTAFFYFPDSFTKPYPFEADVAVSIDDVFEKKIHGLDALESQVYDGGALGNPETPKQRFADDPERRKKALAASWENRHAGLTERFRETLVKWYGEEAGNAVTATEAFELCEYGHRPSEAELRRLFPFFPEAESEAERKKAE